MHPFLDPWYAALNSPCGYAFETNDIELARNKLYAARREASDPSLSSLSIVLINDQLWIVHSDRTSPA